MEKWEVRDKEWAGLCTSLRTNLDVYIWGSSGTGKTEIVKDALSSMSLPFLYINSIEHFSFKSVFKVIRETYMKFLEVADAKNKDPHKCALSLKDLPGSEKIFYVVLDKAQKLINIDVLIINRLLEISRISECSLRYVVITESYLEDIFIHPDTIDREFKPFKLFLPDYTAKDLYTILKKEYNYGSTQDFTSFFEIINQILLPYTSKIFHFRTAFNKTYELFLNLSLTSSHEKLFHFIARELGSIEISFFQKFKSQREYQQDLSTEAKILILSGFICSKNPPRLDAILLKGKRKTEKRRARQEYSSQVPPEKFSLQRLQGVYSILLHLQQECNTKAILSTPIETPSFCSLINTLTQKKIFILVSKKDPLGSEKLMCTAEYDFCAELANSLGIKLSEYIIDLN